MHGATIKILRDFFFNKKYKLAHFLCLCSLVYLFISFYILFPFSLLSFSCAYIQLDSRLFHAQALNHRPLTDEVWV